jgi:SAM-dependent methyltransferase
MTKADQLRRLNKEYYELFWKNRYYIGPEKWPHWQMLREYMQGRCLEIGPGTRPKIPVPGNYFMDISPLSLQVLEDKGGKTCLSDLRNKLPYKSGYFDFVCAYEILEHLPNDIDVVKEIYRILKPEGILSVSFPLHSSWFHGYDDYVGHIRRYDPDQLDEFFRKGGFEIIKYTPLRYLWANKFIAGIYTYLIKHHRGLFERMTHFGDFFSTKFKLIQNIKLHPWSNKEIQFLADSSNGLFILKKIN